MPGGAPTGNHNAARGRVWRDAIDRALAKRSKADAMEAINALAETLLKKCDEGDVSALKEFGDRMEGKSAQPIVGEPGGAAIVVQVSGSDSAL